MLRLDSANTIRNLSGGKNMSKWTMSFAATAVLGLAVSFAQAAPIASWDTSGGDSTNGSLAGTPGANVASGVLDVGSGLDRETDGTLDGYGGDAAATDTLALAIGADDYLSVVITPEAGYNMSFDNVAFNWADDRPKNGTLSLLADVTQSTTGLWDASDVLAEVETPDTGQDSQVAFNIDLSGVTGLQSVSSPVEFRLYYWGLERANPDNFAIGTLAVNGNDPAEADLVFNGTVVPEPTTMGLLALGAVGVIRRRRRA